MKPASIIAVLLLTLVSTGLVAAATTSLSSLSTGQVSDLGASYKVTLLKYEPIPAKPGNTLDVWLQVSNNGDRQGSGLELAVQDSFPFTPVSQSDRAVTIGSLAARSDYVAKVTLRVDRDATDGTFTLPVTISLGNGATSKFSLPIEVKSGRSAVSVASAKTTPAEATPGNRATLALSIDNLEAGELQDVTVMLSLDDSVFAPVQGTNQQKVSRLAGGSSATFSFPLIVEPDAASDVYRIPVTITATSTDGEEITQQETVGVVVRAEPELSVIIDSTELYKVNEQGTVLLRLVNKGLSELKFAQTELLAGDGYEVVGNSPVVYVGNIDSDDFETTEYAVKPTQDSFSLKLRVTYKDALNNAYDETVQLPVKLQPKAAQGGSTVWLVVIVLVVLIVGIYLWRRSRKSKR